MQNKHIIICGGGIGGLCAAITLAKSGAQVTVLEQSETLGAYGAGIQLSPNAMHILRALDLGTDLEKTAFEPEAGILRDFKSGKPLLTTKMKDAYEARYGEKYLNIHRADLHSALSRAAHYAGVVVQTGVSVSGYEQDAKSVMALTSTGAYEGDILIGADGIKSAIRGQMHPKATPQFTGQIAWRGLVDAADLPEGTLPPAANNWLGPARHFVSYYVRSGTLINFVAVMETDEWAEEDWRQDGDMDRLHEAFGDFDPCVRTILDACKSCQLWGLFDRPPLTQWTEGRAALLGDAAHPMLPFMAQGAAMAIEDAWVLAHMVSNHGDATMALTAYQKARATRANFIQSVSRNNAKLYHFGDPAQKTWRALKFKIASKVPMAAHSQLDPIFGVNLTRDYPIKGLTL